MSDDAFRPQRKSVTTPVSPQEESPADSQEKLESMARMRAAIQEDGDGDGVDPMSQQEKNFQIEGNVPPAFKQAMQRQQSATKNRAKPRQRQNEFTDAPPEMRITGSSILERLLAGIQPVVGTYDELVLPSQGRFYDGTDGPKGGVIHVRPMTGEEEQILATPRFVKKGQAINMIFSRCIQERIEPQNLLTADRTYLLIFLRGISYTPEYDVEVRCTECDTKFATVIDLNALYVNNCPENFDPKSLSGTLPTTGYKYVYRLSRGADEQDIQEHRERKMKGFDTAGLADDTLIYRTAQLLEEIEGLTNKLELIELIKRLPISDVAHLRNMVNEPPFGVDTNIEIPCPSCLAEFTVDLPLEANFFFPRKKMTTQNTTPA